MNISGSLPRVGPNLCSRILSLFCFWDELIGMISSVELIGMTLSSLLTIISLVPS